MSDVEPQAVQDARAVIRAWELRQGHETYVDCLDGGRWGYQAACWTCDFRGTEFLRGDEEIGTDASRAHKKNAAREANEHRQATVPVAA